MLLLARYEDHAEIYVGKTWKSVTDLKVRRLCCHPFSAEKEYLPWSTLYRGCLCTEGRYANLEGERAKLIDYIGYRIVLLESHTKHAP